MPCVLIVDDEESLRSALTLILKAGGYDVISAPDAVSALAVYERSLIDLVVLDVMLPGMDGFEFCGLLRQRDPDLPILMLSAKSDIIDKKYGFRAGADDYLGKPFDEEELLLRVEALMRRRNRIRGVSGADGDEGTRRADSNGKMEYGDLTVDAARTEVLLRGEPVQLTRKEYEIVCLLASRPGTVFTKDDIIEEIWGSEYRSTSISIPTYIRRIRMKLEKDPATPQFIQTVFGFGYRLGS